MDLENVVDESGPATQEECPTCGSLDYFQEGGFYYCTTCNTQSQISQLYVEDEYRFRGETQQGHGPARIGVAILRGPKGKKKTTEAVNRYQLSTWEIWNVVLKTMADRLIEIGFPETVADKIFHIYVSFLLKRKVIFVSTTNPAAKSTVTLMEPKTNLYTLYGAKKYTAMNATWRKASRRKIKVNKKAPADEELNGIPNAEYDNPVTVKRMNTRNKRKAIEKDYLAAEKQMPSVDEREFENMIDKERQGQNVNSGTKAKSSRLVYTRTLRRLIAQRGSRCKHRFKLRATNPHKQLMSIKWQQIKFECFTLNTCLITVFVALRELGFPILMSDILRLNRCGILHVENIRTIITQFEEYKDINQSGFHVYSTRTARSLQCLGEDIDYFLTYLEIKKFNYPKIKEIVPKFIDEFVLPREFECLMNLINDMFSFREYVEDLKNTLSLERYRALPELIVLVQLVVILKMLFGLDDKTEKFQSSFAKLVNKVIKEQVTKQKKEMEEWTELFVIEDWFGYLQRRKDVVEKEMCSPAMYTPNNPASVAKLQALLTSCTLEDNNQEDSSASLHEKAAKSCKTLLQTILKETSASEDNAEVPQLQPYIPLPLPTESIVRQYVERYPLVGDATFKPELLNADFVQKRLDFIWNPQKYTKLLKLSGYKVKIIKGDAINNFPHELEQDIAESKVVILFQPYKSFDEFVGRCRSECSISMKFVLGLCEDIIPEISPEKIELRHAEPLLQKLVNAVGDMFIKRVLLELIPVMTRWEHSDSE